MRLVPLASALLLIVIGSASRVDAQSVEPGRRVFASRCAACHGTEGGGGELGPSIVARVPLKFGCVQWIPESSTAHVTFSPDAK